MRRPIAKRARRLTAALLLIAAGLLLVLALAGCADDGGTSASPSSSDSGETTASPATAQPAVEDTQQSEGGEPVPDPTPSSAGPADAATGEAEGAADEAESAAAVDAASTETDPKPLPLLLDLGATKCIPCKKMAPILEELAETKKDFFEVRFVDVWENRDKAHEYGVRIIPTQIFYAADGTELYRHIGFYSRKQILDKWRSLGIDVGE